MRRREFILLLSGAMVSSATAVAPQNNKKRLVGIITGFNDKEMMPAFAAFRARMQELGWIEGKNIAFDLRPAGGDYEKVDREAQSLVAAPPDVIVAQGTPGVTATRRSVQPGFRSCWPAIDRQLSPAWRQYYGLDQLRI